MSKIVIAYHMRLGDVARCLPIAKHFHDQGHEVYFECAAAYHGLFEMVDYCQPVPPRNDIKADRRLDLQIWPDKFAAFESSGKNWSDFVYGLFPEGAEIDRQITLRPPAIVVPLMVKDCTLVFPTGYSQAAPIPPGDVLLMAHRIGNPVVAIGKQEHGMMELQSIEVMCAWIRYAKQVLTINTSASILASALRKSWIHISDKPNHDFRHPNQIRIERF